MIENHRQYQVAKSQIAKLQTATEMARNKGDRMDARVYRAMIGGLESQIKEIQAQVEEYESLAGSSELRLDRVEDLPTLLIRARIARGFTQKELADRLGVRPQQIQKYEKTRYRSASFKRILETMRALRMEMEGDVRFASEPHEGELSDFT